MHDIVNITSCGSKQVPMVINPVISPAQQDPIQPKMANGGSYDILHG